MLGKGRVELQFLPFEVGSRQCSLLFLNDDIGEFLYFIEGQSTLPLPTEVPFHREQQESRSQSRVTSALAAQHSQGVLKEDHRIIYLHCESDKESVEELNLPIRNIAKEKAFGMKLFVFSVL